MKRALVAAVIVMLILTTIAGSQDVGAVSKTIVVPDDYPTITVAVDNAADGDTILVKSGTYEGPIGQTIVIDKTLTIIGENVENTVINLYPAYNVSTILWYAYYDYSDAIDIVADDFRLLNLNVVIPALTSTPSLPGYMVVSQKGGGISATGDRIEIAGNKITTRFSVKGSYCKISNNVAAALYLNGSFNEVSRNSLGISIEGASNIIKDNVCTALHLSHSNSNFVSGNKVLSTSAGYSGIDVSWSDNNVFCGNEIYGFTYGFRLWFSSGNMIVQNTIDDPDVIKISVASMSFGNSSNNRIYLNNFIDDHAQYVYDFYTDGSFRSFFPDMTPSPNFWDNGTRGNYWENYFVSDENGDGVGDTPYIIDENNQDNYPLMEMAPVIPEFSS